MTQRSTDWQPSKSLLEIAEAYTILLGGIALIIGLYVSSAYYSPPVVVKPMNPLVHVDMAKFVASVEKLQSKTFSLAKFESATDWKVLTPEGTMDIVYTLPWYRRYVSARPSARLAQRLDANANPWDQMDAVILKEHLDALGYDFPGPPPPELFRRGYLFENTVDFNKIDSNPFAVYHNLGQTILSGRSKGYHMAIVSDPFHELFKRSDDIREKRFLYEALLDASTFHSMFIVHNRTDRDLSDIRISANLEGVRSGQFTQTLLSAYEIEVDKQVGDTTRLNIIDLPAGPRAYKIIDIQSTGKPIPRYRLKVDPRGIAEQVANHFWFIVILPMVILLGARGLDAAWPKLSQLWRRSDERA